MEYEKLPTDSEERMLVKQILDAAEEERGLIKQIKAITGGNLDTSSAESLTLSEDSSLIPELLQRELQEKRAEIACYMEKAVEIGIGAFPMIQSNYEKYVGKKMPE